jgi:hypothetical protein
MITEEHNVYKKLIPHITYIKCDKTTIIILLE